jgi:hypothetical protein
MTENWLLESHLQQDHSVIQLWLMCNTRDEIFENRFYEIYIIAKDRLTYNKK